MARAWSKWPTEKSSPSLMHTMNDYLSDVGSKKAVSFMVLEKNGPPIWYFFDHVTLSIYSGTIHRFVYYRVPPGSSPILANFSIRKLSGAITFDWKGLFSICKKPLEAKGLFFRFDTRVGAVSGGAGAWLGPKSIHLYWDQTSIWLL